MRESGQREKAGESGGKQEEVKMLVSHILNIINVAEEKGRRCKPQG